MKKIHHQIPKKYKWNCREQKVVGKRNNVPPLYYISVYGKKQCGACKNRKGIRNKKRPTDDHAAADRECNITGLKRIIPIFFKHEKNKRNPTRCHKREKKREVKMDEAVV